MGKWFQEEVAGDRYIFDSDANPVVLGCPQGAPVFVVVGEQDREVQRACDAHNADIDALEARIAELESTDHYQRSLDEMHLRYNVEANLAAANATLDKLREVVGPDKTISNKTCMEMVDILYPAPPKETTE